MSRRATFIAGCVKDSALPFCSCFRVQHDGTNFQANLFNSAEIGVTEHRFSSFCILRKEKLFIIGIL